MRRFIIFTLFLCIPCIGYIDSYIAVDTLQQSSDQTLVSSVYTLTSQLSDAMEDSITHLEQEKSYWLWAQAHPWRHFLSKSPITWFSGQQQEHSVAEQLALIKELLADLYINYGHVVKRKTQFAQYTTPATQDKWSQDTLVLINSMVLNGASCFKQDASFEQSVVQFNALVDLCNRYVHTVNHRISCLQRPHHVTRYWIPYTAAAVGAISAYLFYRDNKQAVDTFITEDLCGKYPTSIKEMYKKNFSDKYHDFIDLLLDTNQHEKPNFDVHRQSTNETCDQLIIMADSIQTNAKDVGERFKSLNEDIATLQNMKVDPIEVKSWIANVEVSNFQDQAQQLLKVAGGMCAYAKALMDNVLENVAQKAEQSKTLIEGGRNQGMNIIDQVEDGADMGYELLNKKLSVTIGMLAMVPALAVTAGATWGTYKTIVGIKHWFTKHDFRLIRSHMSNIHDVLINTQGTTTDEQYGRFMYGVHKLHMQAYKNVPYHHRDAFITHLKQLASDTLDINQKKEMITNMRFTYEFLSPLFIA